MAIDPRAVKFHTLGNKLVEEQKFNDAIIQFERAIEIAPDYDAAYYHLAEAFEAKKMEEKAYEYYQRAIEMNNSHAMLHIESGLDTLLSGPLGKAVADFKKKKGLGRGGAPIVSGPRQGSPADDATKPAIVKEKSRGQKELKPVKVHIRPSDLNVSTEAGTADSIIVLVLGNKDIPVAEGRVTFQIKNDPAQADAFLVIDPSKIQAESGPRKLVVATDENGEITIHMKRSKHAGPNRLDVQAEGLSSTVFVDNTHPGPVSSIEISPAGKHFKTGQEVEFSYRALDGFGNPIPDLDLAIALNGKMRDRWEVEDNAGGRTDAAGMFAHKFRMPTRGNLLCRLDVANKKTGFKAEKIFKVVPGRASSMIFIPAKATVAAGKKFTLKLRLMDEFDNPIEGLKADILLGEAAVGRWEMGKQSSAETGEDGGVSVEIVAPPEGGARASFVAGTEALAPEFLTGAVFETSAAAVEIAARKSIDDMLDMDVVAEKQPAAFSGGLADIEIGAGDLSGLPDLTEGNTPFEAGSGGKRYIPNETEFAAVPGGAAALEGLDLDIGVASPFSGRGEIPGGPGKEPAAPAGPGGGNAFDQLGAMLDADIGGAREPAAPAGLSEPAHETVVPAYEGSPSPPLPEPAFDSTGEPALEYEPAAVPDDSVVDLSDADIGASFEPSGLPAFGGRKEPPIVLDVGSEEITCRAGDVLPVKVRVLDATKRPVSADVSVAFAIEENAGSEVDSYFLTPSGIQGEKTYESEPDMSGEVTSNIQVSSKCGQFDVSIRAQSAAVRVRVSVAPGVPSTIKVAGPSGAVAPGEQVGIAARVLDKFGNPVPGEFVAMSLAEYVGAPGSLSANSGQTDMDGIFKVLYQASEGPGDTATVTASNPNVGVFAVTPAKVIVSGAPAAAATPGKPPQAQTSRKAQPPAAPEPAVSGPALPGISGMALSEDVGQYELADLRPMSDVEQSVPLYEAEPAVAARAGEYGETSEPGGFIETATEGMSEEEYNEYLQQVAGIQDPYAPPTFDVKRGKKPVMELTRVFPRILKYSAIVIIFLLLCGGGLYLYRRVLYSYYYQRGIVNYSKEDFANALNFFEKAGAATKDQKEIVQTMQFVADIYIRQGETYRNQKGIGNKADDMFNNALRATNSLLQADPNNTDGYYYEGKAYEGKRSYCKALTSFENMIRIDPNNQSASEQAKMFRKYCNEERRLWNNARRGGVKR
jgi:tetratricopeptide (TPR) repeat protein